MARCSISPRLLFTPRLSLSSMLAFILYFYPQSPHLPKLITLPHRPSLESPATLSPQKISTKDSPNPLAPCSIASLFSTNYLAPIAPPPLKNHDRLHEKTSLKNQAPNPPPPKKAQNPPPISIFLPSQPHSPFSLLKSIAHTCTPHFSIAPTSSRLHKHPKKHPLASKKHLQNLIPKNSKI